jgi:predicted DCC family thiol-disulfide oxidoreductase YuxK
MSAAAPNILPDGLPDGLTGDLIVFDGTCVFCSGFAQFMTRHDTARRFRFVTAHSPTGQALYRHHDLDPEEMETNIVIVGGKAYTHMHAFAAAMRTLSWPWKIASIVGLLPDAISKPAYLFIARNRYRIGRRACPMPSPELKARLIE